MVRKWPVVTHLLPLKPLAQRILGVRGWGTAHMIHKWPVVIHLLPSTSRWRMGAAHLVPNSSVGTPSCPLAFNWVYQHLCVGWVQNPMVRNFHAHDSIPFHSIPFHSAPFHPIPLRAVPFHSIRSHSIRIGCFPDTDLTVSRPRASNRPRRDARSVNNARGSRRDATSV